MIDAKAPIAGMLFGGLGVLAFSMSLPATRLAIAGGLSADFITNGRGVIAGVLALVMLVFMRMPLPSLRVAFRSAVVSIGVVFGFPLCTSLALAHVSASHGVIVTALLPAATSTIAAVRFRERLPLAFWVASFAGLCCVLVFAASQVASVSKDDYLLFAAVVLGALGYAEGGDLAKEVGSVQTISLALILALPITATLWVFDLVPAHLAAVSASAWISFAYLALVSMFAGFLVWYKGLALGGIARIGQLQLAQPLLSLLWSALFLGEVIGAGTLIPALGVLVCIVGTQRGAQAQHLPEPDRAAAVPIRGSGTA